MLVLVSVLLIIVAILLVLIVLLQNPKGGGLSSAFGSASNQFMGVKKTGDVLEKLTWGFFIGLIILCLSSNAAITGINTDDAGQGGGNKSEFVKSQQKKAQSQQQQGAPANNGQELQEDSAGK